VFVIVRRPRFAGSWAKVDFKHYGFMIGREHGADWGLDTKQRFESAISKTLGYELYGKWVGWSG
jgi:hypothetical protein